MQSSLIVVVIGGFPADGMRWYAQLSHDGHGASYAPPEDAVLTFAPGTKPWLIA